MRYGRAREEAARSQERREREDTAARLRSVVPGLSALKLEMSETTSKGGGTLVRYTKLIVVDRAPALFEFRCGDSGCDGRAHDLTREIMAGLREGRTDFSGENPCDGYQRDVPCGRSLRFRALATYDASVHAPEA